MQIVTKEPNLLQTHVLASWMGWKDADKRFSKGVETQITRGTAQSTASSESSCLPWGPGSQFGNHYTQILDGATESMHGGRLEPGFSCLDREGTEQQGGLPAMNEAATEHRREPQDEAMFSPTELQIQNCTRVYT